MLNDNLYFNAKVLSADVERKSTRDGFGTGSVEVGKTHKQVVVLCADLAESTRAEWFQKEFPERYIEMGVAEQNLAAVASGLAAVGKIPFITSYAAFNPGRNYEQIRTTIALNNQHVIVCGMHAGVSVGPDGATHQMLEDIGLMRMLPHMTVVVPADAEEARKATIAAVLHGSPTYLRFGRSAVPCMTTKKTPFYLGEAYTVWESKNPVVGIVACGSLVVEALHAAKALEEQGVNTTVLNMHTIKPLDTIRLLDLAKKVKVLVTVEEHQIAGGMGSAVSEWAVREHPMRIAHVGMRDVFGQSGEPEQLLRHYGLDARGIQQAVHDALS